MANSRNAVRLALDPFNRRALTRSPQMPKNPKATLAAVAAVAFLVGRWSASEAPPHSSLAAQPPAAMMSAQPPDSSGLDLTDAAATEVAPVAREEPIQEPQQSLSSEGPVYFPNCSAARAAGAAPIRVGEAGYASHLDRDGDGVACE